jgi:hypothetical protein
MIRPIIPTFIFGCFPSILLELSQSKTLAKSFWLENGCHSPPKLGRGGKVCFADQIARVLDTATIQASMSSAYIDILVVA